METYKFKYIVMEVFFRRVQEKYVTANYLPYNYREYTASQTVPLIPRIKHLCSPSPPFVSARIGEL